jgi:phage shock protein PspC (stress-responsive transcriptional regulator)/tetrahydromethanopterin S-methyltransferase subunit G
MKKTVTSSIGRVAFHVEEDAHLRLSGYLDAVSQSLRGSAGHDEIMADIEARVAELLLQRIKDAQQVVTMAEVEEIIGIMGTPDAFSTGGEGGKKQEYSYSTGAGQQYGHKRVFRDPDDKMIFGVCSGVAHYFGFDPIWLRLAFVVSFFLFGFGVMLYIILAIVIPKARTSAEKLEMKGQPADLNNIKRTVEEELNDLKKRVENVKADFQSGRYRNTGRDFGRNVGDLFYSVGTGVGGVLGAILRAIFAFIGFILIFIFSVILLALLVTLFSGVNVVHMHMGDGHMLHYSMYNVFSMLALKDGARTLLMVGLALFLGVPLIGLIIRIGRAVIGVRHDLRGLKIALFIAWMAGLICILIVSMQTFGHFSVAGNVRDEVKFNTPAKTLYVKMPKAEDPDVNISIDSLNFYVSDDNMFLGTPSLCVETSPDSNFHFVMQKSARGISQAEANESAKGIDYTFSQHDSVLNINPFFELEKGTGWRKQKLELTLLVPQNKQVALPDGIDQIMCSTTMANVQQPEAPEAPATPAKPGEPETPVAPKHHHHHHIESYLGGHTWMMGKTGLVAPDSTKK